MSNADSKFLCVMTDDFGMHPAINAGVARAFTDGLLTDTNLMAPCPAFEEAVALVKAHGIPAGMHTTFTNDWDCYHWGALTGAPSLVNSQGWLKETVGVAWRGANEDEALAELNAQYDAIMARGVEIDHISYHMGTDTPGKYYRVMARFARQAGGQKMRPLRLPPADGSGDGLPRFRWNTAFFTSSWGTDYQRRKARLRRLLFSLGPGYHIWMVHAAEDHPSLDALCTPGHRAWLWARAYRALDQALLLDSEVREWVEQLGFTLIPARDAPVVYA